MVLHRNNGALADRLGNGLQNRVEQFDSARHLINYNRKKIFLFSSYFIFHPSKPPYMQFQIF